MATRRPSWRATVVCVPVAVVSGWLAGCSTTQPASPGPPVPATRGTTTSHGDVLTADALALAVRAGPYRSGQQLLLRAEVELTRQCMTARGLTYETGVPSATDDDWWRPDLDSRRHHGYGLRDASGAGSPGVAAGQRPTYRRALVGDAGARATLRLASGREFTFGTSGCIAASRTRLYGDVFGAAQVSYAPQDAYRTLYPRIEADPAMTAAMGQWAACMVRRGHGYPSMAAARRAVAEAAGTPDVVSRFEIRVAVDDAECVLAARVPETVDRVGARVASELPARQRQELNATATLRAAALGQVAAVPGVRSSPGEPAVGRQLRAPPGPYGRQ